MLKYYNFIDTDNYKLEIYKDEDIDSPIEDEDFFGKIICEEYEDNYIGHDHNFNNLEEIESYIKSNNLISIPIYIDEMVYRFLKTISLFTHTKKKDIESRQIGFIYVSYKETEEKFNNIKDIKKALSKSLRIYNDYLNNRVYSYKLYYKIKYKGKIFSNSSTVEWLNKIYNKSVENEKIFIDSVLIENKKGFYGKNLKENGIIDNLPIELKIKLKEKEM